MDRISIMDHNNEVGAFALKQSGRIALPRPVKIQVCLSAEERARLSEQARAAGYDTVSAFICARTLGGHRHA